MTNNPINNHFSEPEIYSGLLTDFYQLTMLQGYFYSDPEQTGTFDMFFRKPPFGSGFAIFAGLDPLIDALTSLTFSQDDIQYLASLEQFQPEFLDYLSTFKFSGSIYSVQEGTVVFPNEPLLRVHGKMIETQLIETILLNIINFQTLIATKSARIKQAAKNGQVLEFGMRRAQGINGAMAATRAAFIGGTSATSNVYAGKTYQIPVRGTMAHSWVMSFNSEIESFEKFAEIYPNNCVLLVDTYDTLKSGVKNAITILKKLKEKGHTGYGIRLDSGDLAFLSIKARKMLDDAELKDAIIVASNDLDELIIKNLMEEGARIDSWGVGTRLVTGGSDPALSGVYKLSSRGTAGNMKACMKITNNPAKMSNPGEKNIFRFYDANGKMCGDLIYLLENENGWEKKIEQFDPIKFNHRSIEYSFFTLKKYKNCKKLMSLVVQDGKRIMKRKDLLEIQAYTKLEIATLDPSHRRLLNPHIYKVSISDELKSLKYSMIKKTMK